MLPTKSSLYLLSFPLCSKQLQSCSATSFTFSCLSSFNQSGAGRRAPESHLPQRHAPLSTSPVRSSSLDLLSRSISPLLPAQPCSTVRAVIWRYRCTILAASHPRQVAFLRQIRLQGKLTFKERNYDFTVTAALTAATTQACTLSTTLVSLRLNL